MSKLNPNDINKILKGAGLGTPDDLNEMDVQLDELNSFGDKNSLSEIYTDISKYNQMLKERITFCNEDLTEAIPFTRENLYLICAYSGNGKSTLAANVSYPLWKQGKKTLVIANEEPKQDILFRIACLELGLSFNSYKKGRMPADQQVKAAKLFPEISKYVKILDVNYKDGLTTKVEGVKNALRAIEDADYSCAMIDYFQLIKFSVERPAAKSYDVLNDFRIWLGQYIKRANVPIVLFAQLHSLGKRNNKDLDSRIKDAPTIYETATVVLEVVPNFEDKTSDIIIAKDRFGLQGNRITCGFENGRYVKLTDEFQRRIIDNKLEKITAKTEEENNESE